MSKVGEMVRDGLPYAFLAYMWARIGLFGRERIPFEARNTRTSTGLFYNTAYWEDTDGKTLRVSSIRPFQ